MATTSPVKSGNVYCYFDYTIWDGGYTINYVYLVKTNTTQSLSQSATEYITVSGQGSGKIIPYFKASSGSYVRGLEAPSSSAGYLIHTGSSGGSMGFAVYQNAGEAKDITLTLYAPNASAMNGQAFTFNIYETGTTPTVCSINPTPSRDSINLNRSWDKASECQYNINDSGWVSEGTETDNFKVSGNSVTKLTPNKSYKCQIAIRYYGSDWKYSDTKTVYTTHNKPNITNINATATRNECIISRSVAYDNAKFASHKLSYYKTSSGGASPIDIENTTDGNFSLTGLSPNTSYSYTITENDDGKNSETSSVSSIQTFKTIANPPTLIFNGSALNSHTVMFSIDGTTCDENTSLIISSCYINYKKVDETIQNKVTFGNDKTITLDSLTPNVDYNLYLYILDDAGNIITKNYIFKIIGNIKKGTKFINKILKNEKEITEVRLDKYIIKSNKLNLTEVIS